MDGISKNSSPAASLFLGSQASGSQFDVDWAEPHMTYLATDLGMKRSREAVHVGGSDRDLQNAVGYPKLEACLNRDILLEGYHWGDPAHPSMIRNMNEDRIKSIHGDIGSVGQCGTGCGESLEAVGDKDSGQGTCLADDGSLYSVDLQEAVSERHCPRQTPDELVPDEINTHFNEELLVCSDLNRNLETPHGVEEPKVAARDAEGIGNDPQTANDIDPHYNVFDKGQRFYSHYSKSCENIKPKEHVPRGCGSTNSSFRPCPLLVRIRERLRSC